MEADNSHLGDVQKIAVHSPLATWLLNKNVGDIVKMGNMDNYIEVKEIEN
jgi:transcription elongation GreA/GreB family factor